MKKIIKVIAVIVFAFGFLNSANAQTEGTQCFKFNTNLRPGSTGPEVVTLQYFLTAKKYTITDPSGVYGQSTKDAVRSFQSTLPLPDGTYFTGYFGPATRAILNDNKLCITDIGASDLGLPHISVLSPGLVSVGDIVKLTGTKLVSTLSNGVNVANINIKSLDGSSGITNPTINSYNPTELRFITPNIKPGDYYVTVNNDKGESNTTIFTVKATTAAVTNDTVKTVVVTNTVPASITKISTKIANIGDSINIFGTGFDGVSTSGDGSYRIYLRNSNGGEINPVVTYVSSNQITFTVPRIAMGTYKVSVLGNGGLSNDIDLRIDPAARIDSVQPDSVKAGDTVTLTGVRFFGVDATRVFLRKGGGEINPPVLISSDANKIVFKVPNVPTGTYTVTVLGSSGLSNPIDIFINPNTASVDVPATVKALDNKATTNTTNTTVNNSQYTTIIGLDKPQATYNPGNVVINAEKGPVDGVYYRWNITDSYGGVKSQQNGYVIQKLYYNFTTPGVYKVNLSVVDKVTQNVVSTSNTVQVTIVNPNGASPFGFFDWFADLFR